MRLHSAFTAFRSLVLGFCAASFWSSGYAMANDGLRDLLPLHDQLTLEKAGNPDVEARLKRAGVSVLPPKGDGWIEAPRTAIPDEHFDFRYIFTFTKVVAQPNPLWGQYSVIAYVGRTAYPEVAQREIAANPDGWIDYMMRTFEPALRLEPRHKAIKVDARLEEKYGAKCFRVDMMLEDHGVPGFENRPFVLDAHGYNCISPSFKYLVSIIYSQRVPPRRDLLDVKAEGEAFLEGFKFED